VGDECVGGRDSLTGWGRIEGGIEDGGQWVRRSRKSIWEVEQWIVAQKMEGK
jgi:hypothetical protein